MMHRLFFIAVILSLGAGVPEARACSVCGCGDPLLAASDPAAITGRLRLQADVEYLRVDAGSDGQPGFTDQLAQSSYRFNVVYRPIDDLALTATVPVVTKAIHMVGPGSNTLTSSLSGLGDLELGGRYALWRSVELGRRRVQEVAVTGGSSFPTGNNSALASDGSRVDEHGQLGTGSFGPYAGLAYRFEQAEWEAFASVSGRMRTQNSHSYTYGAAVLWSAHGQYRPVEGVAVDLGIDGRYARADRDTGDAVPNTGGLLVAAAPGVYVNVVGEFWLFARGQVPFWKRLSGEQDVKPSIIAGLQYQLL